MSDEAARLILSGHDIRTKDAAGQLFLFLFRTLNGKAQDYRTTIADLRDACSVRSDSTVRYGLNLLKSQGLISTTSKEGATGLVVHFLPGLHR